MRILLVTDVPLLKELGAAQMAINLTEALKLEGHEVILWTPHPKPNMTRWWQGFENLQLMRSKLDEFLQTQKPFDLIDSCTLLITEKLSKSGVVIARSVQPEILYAVSNLRDLRKKNIKTLLLQPFNYFSTLIIIFLLLQAWARAKYIFCLGSLEFRWMKKYFPWWNNKFIYYFNSLAESEQKELAHIRLNRVKFQGEGIRFLWIGRWSYHKGISELTDFIVKRSESHPQDTFTIAGCGVNVDKDFSSELIQSGNLKIVPSFSRDQLYSLLANHDVGLFTSKVEGWGLVLNEMLESGMVVFATYAGGVPDLQPFFKEMLKPFPPPSNLDISTIKTDEFKDEYYENFTWFATAKMYLSLKSQNLESVD